MHERSPVTASKYFLGVFPKPIIKFNIQTRHIDSSILWAQLLVTILQEANVNRLNRRYVSGTFVVSTIFSSCSLLKLNSVKAKETMPKYLYFLVFFPYTWQVGIKLSGSLSIHKYPWLYQTNSHCFRVSLFPTERPWLQLEL